MSENNHDDQYRIPEPLPVEPHRFDAPAAPTPPEPSVPPDSLQNSEPAGSYESTDASADLSLRDTIDSPEPLWIPEPLVGTEPVPAMVPGLVPAHPLSGELQEIRSDLREIRQTTTRTGRVVEEVVAWLKTLASAAVYATLIVTFGFQVARVEGHSMAPTLADQDRLIVNKLAYRIGEPHVGDIVMLYYPLNPEKSFVKRVIAEEGDQVRIVEGRVYRNDVLINDDYVPSEYRSHDDWGPEVIPEGYYFVMGDHRNSSSDSRHWRFVPKKYIIGKVQLRWWPLPKARLF
jgi:signal peptidase I